MSFDTTASVRGRKQDACVLIKQELQKRSFVSTVACCHHILELFAQTAFTTIMGSTDAPKVSLFKRFQAQWNFLDKKVATTIANDEELSKTVKDLNVISWAEKSLRERKELRDDYKEFIKLYVISMGFTSPRGRYLFYGFLSNPMQQRSTLRHG